MTLDNLPIMSKAALELYEQRHKDDKAYLSWIRSVNEYLLSGKNPLLNAFIESYASDSEDPAFVRGLAYTLITLINDQMEIDKRNKSGGRK